MDFGPKYRFFVENSLFQSKNLKNEKSQRQTHISNALYILARSLYGAFSITSENIPCGINGVSCTKSIYFKIGQTSIHLLRGKEVMVNNVGILLPKKYGIVSDEKTGKITSDVTIKRVGSLRTLIHAESIGVTLLWDGRTTIQIFIEPNQRKLVSGLCGNYDGRAENDFSSRQGVVETNAFSFANTWRVSQACSNQTDRLQDACGKAKHRLPCGRG